MAEPGKPSEVSRAYQKIQDRLETFQTGISEAAWDDGPDSPVIRTGPRRSTTSRGVCPTSSS